MLFSVLLLSLALCGPAAAAATDAALLEQLMNKVDAMEKELSEQRAEISVLKEGQASNTLVAFSVVLVSSSTVTVEGLAIVPFNTITSNAGNGWDSTAQQFVAPDSGTYMFFYHNRLNSGSARIRPYKNDERLNIDIIVDPSSQAESGNMVIVELTAGDRIDVRPDTTVGLAGTRFNSFSGFKIASTL